MLGGTGNVIVRLSAVTIAGWDGLWPVALVFDRMDLRELAEAFVETEERNRSRDGVPRRWFVFARKAREEKTMPRRWRDGIRGD